jgi:hypothetical protein
MCRNKTTLCCTQSIKIPLILISRSLAMQLSDPGWGSLLSKDTSSAFSRPSSYRSFQAPKCEAMRKSYSCKLIFRHG